MSFKNKTKQNKSIICKILSDSDGGSEISIRLVKNTAEIFFQWGVADFISVLKMLKNLLVHLQYT